MDCSLLGSSVHGILQARIMEWISMPSSRGSSWPRDQTQVSHIAGSFFTIWATREAHVSSWLPPNLFLIRSSIMLYTITSLWFYSCHTLIHSLPSRLTLEMSPTHVRINPPFCIFLYSNLIFSLHYYIYHILLWMIAFGFCFIFAYLFSVRLASLLAHW